MRLTQIKLSGFKSFPDPTTIEIQGNIVAIVGPNGCGKSNVIDALRWVLGESSARQLRGDSLQDVIFNGSATRPPVSRATVELKFDNGEGGFPGPWGEYAEISVKRLLTRSGESGYWINRQEVRRKDITELFLGTGLSSRGYAVIEQGTVAKMIDAKPEELRAYLDEAAGIAQYKNRRRETEIKLKETRENLTRLQDLQNEYELQVKKLSKDAAAAEKYSALKRELREKENCLTALEVASAAEKIARLKAQKKEVANAISGGDAELTAQKKRAEEFAADEDEKAEELRLLARKEGERRAELARLTAELTFREEEEKKARAEMLRRDAEIARGAKELEKIERELAAGERELAASQQRAAELDQARRDFIKAATESQREFAGIETLYRQKEEELREETQKIKFAEQNLARLQKEIGAGKARIEDLSRQWQTKILIDLVPLEEEKQVLAGELAKLTAELAVEEKERKGLTRQLTVTSESQAGQEEELVKITTELDLLTRSVKELTQKENDFWAAAPAAIEKTPLWSVITVDPLWENAVALYLGEKLYAARAEGLTFESINGVARGGWINRIVAGDNDSVAGDSILTKITLKDSSWEPLLAYWLGSVRVSAGVKEALSRQSELTGSACWLTPEGFIVDAMSVLNRGKITEESILRVRSRLKELTKQKETAAREIQLLSDSGSALREKVEHLTTAIKAGQQKKDEIKQKMTGVTSELSEAVLKNTLYSERRIEIETELKSLQKRKNEAQKKSEDLRALLMSARKALATGERELSDAKSAHAQSRILKEKEEKRSRELAEENNQAEMRLLACKNKISGLITQKKELEKRLAYFHAQKNQDMDLLAATIQAGKNKIAEVEAERFKLKEKTATQTRELEALRQNKAKITGEIEKLRSDGEQLKEEIHRYDLALHEAEIYSKEARMSLEETGEELAKLLALSRERHYEPATLTPAIANLRRRLTKLGRVNLLALDELQAAQDRYEFYARQSEDIRASAELLRAAIEKIDLTTENLFRETLRQVNEALAKFFPLLLGGGTAYLSSVNEEGLARGLTFVAAPAGKKKQTMQLLSGGEKALTALSLVFSLFSLNPAPFCLLDEVDAPLDDANTRRLGRIFSELSFSTQFIFISHNKITMTAAEQLIGVTMEEKGVSQIVAVNLAEDSPQSAAAAGES